MKVLLEEIKNDLTTLFGESNGTVMTLTKLLSNFSSEEVTRQVVFETTRKIFPAKRECHPRIYTATNLEKLDDALKNGVEDWTREGSAMTVAAAQEPLQPDSCGSSPQRSSGLNFSRMEKLYNSIKRKRLDMDL
jgi:hypothetical protein